MNIVIVTSGHPPLDERIFYKFGISLESSGYNVSIVCSTQEIDTEKENIKIRGFLDDTLPKKQKIQKLFNFISQFDPNIIICCEPLTILAADKYRKKSIKETKIIYDITEYYPHQNILNKYSGIQRTTEYILLSMFNAYVSNLTDYLFIGEAGKAKFYDIFVPYIKKTIIGYYPPQKYFQYHPPGYDGKCFTICFAGKLTDEYGFLRYLGLVQKAAERFKDKIFVAKIIGNPNKNSEQVIDTLQIIKNVRVEHHIEVKYTDFSAQFEHVDICIDLRDKNKIFNRSLPIKVFDYMASGKPFIFSNLKSFKGFEDIKNAALLVEPDDFESALDRISNYLDNPDKLKKDSLTVYSLFKDKYNWESEEKKMIKIINSLIKTQ